VEKLTVSPPLTPLSIFKHHLLFIGLSSIMLLLILDNSIVAVRKDMLISEVIWL